MNQFRRLVLVALVSGSSCGFFLFLVQHVTVRPLIEMAERYEHAAEAGHAEAAHHNEGWQPAEGFERTSLTALATTLMGVGFSAILFGTASLTGVPLNARRGMLWGLCGFACFTLAPALGSPPVPPGAGVADVTARQIWWLGAVAATAAGIWMLVRGRSTLIRFLGAFTLFIPHIVGAPAAVGPSLAPDVLVQRFALTSVATNALFWIVMGAVGGSFYNRTDIRSDAG